MEVPMIMRITPAQLEKSITPAMVDAANAVVMARAYAETIIPIVKKYQTAILEKHQFTNKGEIELFKNSKRGTPAVRVITDPKHTHYLSDDDFNVYLEECFIERDKAGLKVDHPQQCPALVAENLVNKARRVLVDAFQPLTGISSETIYGENYNKAVELYMTLIAKLGLLRKAS